MLAKFLAVLCLIVPTLAFADAIGTGPATLGPPSGNIGDEVIGGAANRVLFIDSSGNLADDADLTFDATTLTMGGNPIVTNADPCLQLDVTTATDTDFWISVQEDADGVDDDLFQIGDGATCGTNPFITVDTSGSVGINDTGPDAMLDIVSGSSTTPALRLEGSASMSANMFQLVNSAATELLVIEDAGRAIFQNDTDSTTGFQIFDANGGKPVLNVDTTNERVGIGTASPGAKLEVDGLTSSVAGSAILIGSTFADGVYVNVGTIRTIGVFEGGNLFAGYNTNYDKASNSYEYVAVNNPAAVTEWTTDGEIEFLTKVAGAAGTEYTPDLRMIVKNGGNIGIGTAAPVQELHVVGDVTVADGTPNVVLCDTDSDVGYILHLETAASGAPHNNLTLSRGTCVSSTFTLTVPLITFDDDNMILHQRATGYPIETVTGDTTLDSSFSTVKVDASGGNVTITLPALSTALRRTYNIKKIDSSSNTVTVSGQIDGASSATLTTLDESITVHGDTAEWSII